MRRLKNNVNVEVEAGPACPTRAYPKAVNTRSVWGFCYARARLLYLLVSLVNGFQDVVRLLLLCTSWSIGSCNAETHSNTSSLTAIFFPHPLFRFLSLLQRANFTPPFFNISFLHLKYLRLPLRVSVCLNRDAEVSHPVQEGNNRVSFGTKQ